MRYEVIVKADPDKDKTYTCHNLDGAKDRKAIEQKKNPRCRPECGWNLRCVISNYVKLSDYRFAFKQLPG